MGTTQETEGMICKLGRRGKDIMQEEKNPQGKKPHSKFLIVIR